MSGREEAPRVAADTTRTDAEPEQRAATSPRGGGGPTGARPRGPELVVFVGLQASGKSTFFRERFAETHEHVSKDLLRNNKNRERRQRHLIGAALAAGSSVVVDNTNPTVEERRALLGLGREHGAKAVGYYFESEARRCVERNRRRAGKSRVPDVAIWATAKRLVPPSYSEGFDGLLRVRMAGDGAFEVRPYTGGGSADREPSGHGARDGEPG